MSIFLGLITVLSLCFGVRGADAKAVDCLICHGQLSKEKVVHAALNKGCAVCHAGIDAQDVPHRITNNVLKGLSAPQPDLCYKCHNKTLFSGKKHLHPPLLSGVCTACHDPHGSENEKLLTNDMPALCFNCHDKTKFEGEVVHQPAKIGLCIHCHSPHQSNTAKLLNNEVPGICYQCHQKEEYTRKNIHMPVAGGKCLDCHSPHASGSGYLLSKKPIEVCLDCHPKLRTAPHVLAKIGHPTGLKPLKKKPADKSAWKDKDFYCASCHQPHSSDWKRLFRFEAGSTFELCIHCHKK